MSLTGWFPLMARIIPVLDVLGGRVVRAVGGRRSEYRPVVSRLTDSTEPVTVARKLLEVTGASELYAAELDRIAGRSADLGWLDPLLAAGVQVWLDGGFRSADDLAVLPGAPALIPVGSFETLPDETFFYVVKDTTGRRLAVSIEFRGGEPVGGARVTGRADDRWWLMVEDAMHSGCSDVLLVDLDAVGTASGPSLADHCHVLVKTWPHLRVMVGGGVRDRDDVTRLADAGADAVLVASALHDGTLP